MLVRVQCQGCVSGGGGGRGDWGEALCYPGSLYGRGVQGHIGDTLVHRWVLGLSGKIVLVFDLM